MLSLTISTTLDTQDVNSDYYSGYFDGSIGLEAASENEDYRKGYYEGLAAFLDW